MTWQRTSTTGELPDDAVGDALAEALTDLIAGAAVELSYAPASEPPPSDIRGRAHATGDGPPGWRVTVILRPDERVAAIIGTGKRTPLAELVETAPAAAIDAALPFRTVAFGQYGAGVDPALQRALRDELAVGILDRYLERRVSHPVRRGLVAETIDYLIELSGTRVESHDLTHGVIVADVLHDVPRLQFAYPADVRAAKRAPLLFDGQRALLVLDPDGRARTELQRHRFERLSPEAAPGYEDDSWIEGGALVAAATGVLGGLGFYVRADRSIWTFVDGRPLVVRRREHWTAFPVQLTSSIENLIGGGAAAALIARAAVMISSQPRGAILAVVDDPATLDDVVPLKDRYDLRNSADPSAMHVETRLHHLIDAAELDEQTLVRLALLDGATIVDHDGRLLAYGAIVTSTDSQHEGARTAAARTLSMTADVVLNVSEDGDITIFRGGTALTTLLGRSGVAR